MADDLRRKMTVRHGRTNDPWADGYTICEADGSLTFKDGDYMEIRTIAGGIDHLFQRWTGAADRIAALQTQNRKLVDALIAADALQDALVKHLNAPGGLPREVYATLLTYKTTRAAIAEAAKGEGR